MKKISLLSNVMVGFFSLYLFWLPVSFLLSWYLVGVPLSFPTWVNVGYSSSPIAAFFPPANQGMFNLSHLPVIWKTVAGFVGLVGLLISVSMTLSIIFLFKRYSRSKIFDVRSVKLVRKIGLLFMGTQLFYVFSKTFETFLSTIQTKPVLAITIGTHEVTSLVLGLIVLVVSRIMYEGHKLHQENLYTI